MKDIIRSRIKAELYSDDKWLVINRGELDDRQVELFLELADSYLSEDKYDYPKAIAVSHYVKKVLEKKLSEGKEDKKQIENKLQEVNDRIESVERKFLALVGRDSGKNRSIETHKHKLDQLRNEIKTN